MEIDNSTYIISQTNIVSKMYSGYGIHNNTSQHIKYCLPYKSIIYREQSEKVFIIMLATLKKKKL